MKKRLLACTSALVSATALSGCGLLPGEGPGTRTVTVWLMKNSVSDDFLARFTEAYEKENPSVELEVTFQEWTGIGKKVTSALESGDTPDVIEVGNTQVAQYAETDKLYDLTLESVRDLGREDWLPGLAEPGSIKGSQYGIPWYAANRVVIYNKDLFRRAGIEEPPKTRAQWFDDTEKLNDGDTQGIYLAGQDWYTLAGFIWDEGGELAVEKGGEWVGSLDSPAALKGMDVYRQLQSLGSGPTDADEENPPQAQVFAKGDVAQIIAAPNAASAIIKGNPGLKDKLGFFPIPGKTADKPCAVFTGGSDLIIPEKARERGAAIDVVKALAGEKWQTDLARTMSYVPNKSTLASVVDGQAATAAMAVAAARGRATPNSPQWAAVETDNPIKPYMTAVLEGQDPKQAAKAASNRITDALSG
ncbi:extracellular solute-binding protein [Streptomyces sp. SP18CS02]|uniref:extracellular solute-binding protein n=1 Tax=Streptomyces sp. SP18CS02 TaxID=3002531 RepID=UPI002E7A3353|nr:extracellular solute-binding protein [Streptomyces sp. SP18CS02]MEE1754543.1 extracellular solute-binding protein [Streptomyces sp. SP18CS02]